MADVPVEMPRQKASVPLPKALTTPVPVMTTRFTLLNFGLGRGPSGRGAVVSGVLCFEEHGDSVDHLVDIGDLLGLLVIDLDVEFAFEIEEDVEPVEGVDAEGLKAAVGCNGLEWDALGGRDHFKNSILNGWRGQSLQPSYRVDECVSSLWMGVPHSNPNPALIGRMNWGWREDESRSWSHWG